MDTVDGEGREGGDGDDDVEAEHVDRLMEVEAARLQWLPSFIVSRSISASTFNLLHKTSFLPGHQVLGSCKGWDAEQQHVSRLCFRAQHMHSLPHSLDL